MGPTVRKGHVIMPAYTHALISFATTGQALIQSSVMANALWRMNNKIALRQREKRFAFNSSEQSEKM